MTKTELEIIKLKWHVQILQGLLVKTCWAAFHAMGGSPQEAHQWIQEELEKTRARIEPLMLSEAVPEDRRVLLAEEYAQLVEEMKTSITSMLAAP